VKQITCPHIGRRPLSEFVFGGEVRTPPKANTATDTEWGAHVYHRDSTPGVKQEWWYHGPTGTWFVLERHTQTDEFLRVLDTAEARHEP
jgi:sarcosine oxidase, subunit delta